MEIQFKGEYVIVYSLRKHVSIDDEKMYAIVKVFQTVQRDLRKENYISIRTKRFM